MKDVLKVVVRHLAEMPAKIVGALPAKLQPAAKALVPLTAGALVALDDLTIDATEIDGLKGLAAGAALSLLVYAFPNLKPPAPTVENASGVTITTPGPGASSTPMVSTSGLRGVTAPSHLVLSGPGNTPAR